MDGFLPEDRAWFDEILGSRRLVDVVRRVHRGPARTAHLVELGGHRSPRTSGGGRPSARHPGWRRGRAASSSTRNRRRRTVIRSRTAGGDVRGVARRFRGGSRRLPAAGEARATRKARVSAVLSQKASASWWPRVSPRTMVVATRCRTSVARAVAASGASGPRRRCGRRRRAGWGFSDRASRSSCVDPGVPI